MLPLWRVPRTPRPLRRAQLRKVDERRQRHVDPRGEGVGDPRPRLLLVVAQEVERDRRPSCAVIRAMRSSSAVAALLPTRYQVMPSARAAARASCGVMLFGRPGLYVFASPALPPLPAPGCSPPPVPLVAPTTFMGFSADAAAS